MFVNRLQSSPKSSSRTHQTISWLVITVVIVTVTGSIHIQFNSASAPRWRQYIQYRLDSGAPFWRPSVTLQSPLFDGERKSRGETEQKKLVSKIDYWKDARRQPNQSPPFPHQLVCEHNSFVCASRLVFSPPFFSTPFWFAPADLVRTKISGCF